MKISYEGKYEVDITSKKVFNIRAPKITIAYAFKKALKG